ncbi:hypothetical protein TNCV_4072601 [Trichonephila clavipes]|uniref:Uncharacterized protein n=1 Tax=Trichonephila clavipes TaxID=2585209 RepID=A0A8X6W7V6_TRICX|nr:hypothetical protein TNCV_4072601 [Trichonephila clavipes]
MMWLSDPYLSRAQSACYYEKWCKEVGMISPVCPSFSHAPSDERSAHNCLLSSNTLTDFSKGLSAIPIGYYSSSIEFRNLVKRRSTA